jgi:FtsP/CotA-like multicopper oxidase with cupredoxin domain
MARISPSRDRESAVVGGNEGGCMGNRSLGTAAILLVLVFVVALPAAAQSFRVQCPTSTITHPAVNPNSSTGDNNSEPTYKGATTFTTNIQGYFAPATNVNGAIKCQQIAGGDGYSTMGDGTQTYMFSFGPLSGLSDIALGKPGTQFPSVFNTIDASPFAPGDPATTVGDAPIGGLVPPLNNAQLATLGGFYNGAVGLIGDPELSAPATVAPASCGGAIKTATATANVLGGIVDSVTINSGGCGYTGPVTVTFSGGTALPGTTLTQALGVVEVLNSTISAVDVTFAGANYNAPPKVTIGPPVTGCTNSANGVCVSGHVDPRPIMNIGVMNGNIPAPLMAIDEDDEFFLTLTNVGMIMRPDLFEQHTVHFHGYPNASSFYDGVPDASVAINIGASFTYYYLAPDAGTYFWHCHITPPEHLQMGMVGQIYVRPRQDRVAGSLYAGLQAQQHDLRTACGRLNDGVANAATDILCSNPLPVADTLAVNKATVLSGGTSGYAYNDGDGSTYYDVEYPLQIHGFDPNFHFVGMTFNPEGFTDMKDKYFLLNGRSYPDTVTPGPLQTESADGVYHFSQPLPSIISIPSGGKALLRISDLDVTEYQTLASLGIPMHVIGYNAKLLRDQVGKNMDYYTNSITLGGGESLDVILDASDKTKYPSGSVFYLYTPNLDHLSNDAENFGGLMTEVRIQ